MSGQNVNRGRTCAICARVRGYASPAMGVVATFVCMRALVRSV
jgi:hypothetical protein